MLVCFFNLPQALILTHRRLTHEWYKLLFIVKIITLFMMVVRKGIGPSCNVSKATTIQIVLPYMGVNIEAEVRSCILIFTVFLIANK